MSEPTRKAQKQNTREKVVEAAYGEFVRRGILSTRTDDVAAAAGVSHGTVFAHFKTQEALVSAVIAEYCGRIAVRTHELASGGCTVRAILKAHLAGIAEYEPFYTRLAVELRLLPEECRAVWVSLQSAVSFHLSHAAEREMEEGRIKRVPIHFLFNAWMGLVTYYLSNGDLFAPEGNVVKRYGDELLDNFMKLLNNK
jgi:AcrR family transcriptional regulator